MEKQMCSEKITNLAKAMLEVQKTIRPAYKDKLNDFTHSRDVTDGSCVDNGKGRILRVLSGKSVKKASRLIFELKSKLRTSVLGNFG